MEEIFTLRRIARIRSPFPTKFGIPRQSGRVPEAVSRIVFEPDYRNADALRGLEGYSHLWIIWQFSEVTSQGWSPTVRPPRLGGNRRMGVFATRSPYRPNPLGLSCVRIKEILLASADGPCIDVYGADLLDGTPIFDLKPYLPTADCIPDAVGGFAEAVKDHRLSVSDPEGRLNALPEETRELIRGVLADDPRPAYQNDSARIYSFECAGYRICFYVESETAIVTECSPYAS